MVDKVTGQNNPNYGKITLRNSKTKETKTYFVPLNKQVEIGQNKYDMSQVKNGELVISGDPSKDEAFKLTGLALEHLDANQDGKIDEKDNDANIADKLNNDELKNTDYYIKNTDVYSDAGVAEGEGIVVFSKENQGQMFQVYIGDKDE